MKVRATAIAIAFTVVAPLCAAQDAPVRVLRASSRTVDVDDGGRLLRGGWTVSPDVALDIYYARRAPGDRRITFRSDIDSLTFDVHDGRDEDFVVELAGHVCCRTRISTLRRMPRVDVAAAVPFTIGVDHKIHVVGRINDSEPLDLLVDLGADTVVLFPSGVAKRAKLTLDGQVDNAGSGGTVTRRTSNDNRLSVGPWHWDHESVLFIEKQSDRADGIIGYNVLDNSVVTIDYDERRLHLASELPDSAVHESGLPIRFNGTLPTVPVHIVASGREFDEPLVLDTGSNASVFLDRAVAEKYRLTGSMPHLGSSRMRGTGAGVIENEIMRLPAMRLGSLELRELPVYVETGSGAASRGGHLGMEVLRRFNTVLDLRTDTAHFTPSGHHDEPFRVEDGSGRAWIVAGFIGAAALCTGYILMRRRSRLR